MSRTLFSLADFQVITIGRFWVIAEEILVDRCDEEARLVFGRLDNEPIVNNCLPLGKELAISYDQIREHRKPWEFRII